MSASPAIVTRVGNELTSALQLREALAGEDPQLIADMIEGSTNLHEALAVLVEIEGEEKMLLAGMNLYLADLAVRRVRLELSIKRVRRLIAETMEKADLKRLKTPLATVTLSAGTRGVVVTDETRLPGQVLEPQPDKVSLTKLRALMETGVAIAGAEWRNGQPTLTIRRV